MPFPFSSLRLCRVLVSLLLLTGGMVAWADAKSPPTPRVPIAREAKAAAVRGIVREIRLEGVTASPKQLDFIVRQPPRHGRLEGPPVKAGKDVAVVRYVGNPGSTAATDTFTFAVKVEGIGTSTEATVTIQLEDPAPVLEAPGGVDLGRVLATELLERSITITNRGNAPFRATVPLPEGWSWLHPAQGQFDLPPGESIEATIGVRVREVGPIDQKITLRPGTVVRVIGHARPPFLAHPSLVRLQWERGTARRAWQFTLSNNRPEPQTLQLTAPPGLAVPPAVTVPALESVTVSIFCSGNLDRVQSGQLRLDGQGWSQSIDYEAPVAPAAVVVEGVSADDTVDFGILEKAEGSPARRELTLRNIGGTPAVVRWDELKLFLLEGITQETVLAPSAERRIVIQPRPDKPGRLKEELTLRMNGGDRVLQLLADIDPEAAKIALMSGKVLQSAPAAAVPGAAGPKPAVTGAGLQLRTQVLVGGLMEAIPNSDPTLPRVDIVRLVEEEPDRLVFEWEAPAEGTWNYRVLVRMLRNHGLQQAPIPEYGEMDNVKVTSTPTGGRAEVTKLRGGARWTCRVVAIRSDGVANKAGADLHFITPLKGDSRWTWRLIAVLGAVSLVLYVRQKWREDVKWKD